MVKVGAIIQARTGSSRFPNKVLKSLPCNSNLTVLNQIIRRLKQSTLLDTIILATSTKKEDKKLEKIAKDENIKIFFGSENNVLNRFYECAKKYKIDIIVRITADNPCIDYKIIDKGIGFFLKNNYDYINSAGLPIGTNIEIFNFKALEIANKEASKDYEKEHVCPYIYKCKKFKTYTLDLSKEIKINIDISSIRLTTDTEEDYALICAIYDYLYEKNPYFGIYEILVLLEKKNWLKSINRNVLQKKHSLSEYEELKYALSILELQGLYNAYKLLKKLIEGKDKNDR